MNLRQRLKAETKDLHDRLEQSYPFNKLLSPDLSTDELESVLKLFYEVFYSFIDRNKSRHLFYKSKYDFFKSLDSTLNTEPLSSKRKSDLALNYVFLGSSMGNQMVFKKNKKISESKHKHYFSCPLPTDLWTELTQNLSKVECDQTQNEIIEHSKSIFEELIERSKQL